MSTVWRNDDGTLAVEAALIAPALLVLMLLVVYAGRAAQADADVRSAAARAARAASLTTDAQAATAAATAVATANLTTAGIDCRDPDVRVNADLRAGGRVTVTVGCQVANTDLALLAVPGSRRSTATATQVVDTYRGFGRGFGDSEGSSGANPGVGGGG
jgi:Flp pilus assembly protein TadG